MKIFLIVCLLLPLLTQSSPIDTDIDDISLDPLELTDLEQPDNDRIKRSGFSIFASLQKGLLSGLGRASASIAGGSSSSSGGSLSSGSSGGGGGASTGYSYPGHPVESPHQPEHFDAFALKRSILNTIFQAVKAITGGVTAIKGQLIKGSGYLVSAGGKLIASSGDAVTAKGKQLALSAKLVEPSPNHVLLKLSGPLSSGLSSSIASLSGSSSSSNSHPSSGGDSGHGFTSYEAPSAGHEYNSPPKYGPPSIESGPSYGPPSAPANNYGPPISVSHQYSSGPITSYGSPAPSHDYSDYSSSYNPHSKSSFEKAALVLRQVLNTKTGANFNSKNLIDSTSNKSGKRITQYDIPSDPVPNFRILPKFNLPVDSVTHTQTLTTAYGAPYAPSASNQQNSISPIESIPSNNPTNQNAAYDVYHSMQLKLTPISNSNAQQSIMQWELDPTDLNNVFGGNNNNYEVQKSLEYEFKMPSKQQQAPQHQQQQHIQRRQTNTGKTGDDKKA